MTYATIFYQAALICVVIFAGTYFVVGRHQTNLWV